MSNFEKLEFSAFDLQNILLDHENDPDDNFFNIRWFSDRSYFAIEELSKSELSSSYCNSFSIFYLNIRTPKKNFDEVINF